MRLLATFFLLMLLLTGCGPGSALDIWLNRPLGREQALAIGESAASGHGYNMSQYSLIHVFPELSADKKEWQFYYACKPALPDCGLRVHVNRVTGTTQILPSM